MTVEQGRRLYADTPKRAAYDDPYHPAVEHHTATQLRGDTAAPVRIEDDTMKARRLHGGDAAQRRARAAERLDELADVTAGSRVVHGAAQYRDSRLPRTRRTDTGIAAGAEMFRTTPGRAAYDW